MTAIPPPPSLPPIVMQEIRRDAMRAALATEWPNNPIALMNLSKVYEGFILFGDVEVAWRHAGFPRVADNVAADRAAGNAGSAGAAEPLPANVSALRPKG